MHLGCNSPRADLIHQDGRSAQVSLVEAHVREVIRVIGQICRVSRGERWDFDHDVKTRRVYQTSLSVQRHIDGASKLARIDPEDVNFALGRCDENVIVAWVDIEARNFAIVDKELGQRSHPDPVVLNLDELLFDTVGSPEREDTELALARGHRFELVDEVAASWIVSHLIPLQNL